MTRLLLLVAALAAAPASAQASLIVANRTGQSVHYLYASSCSSSSWGADRLGANTVPAGSQYTFSMSPGCWDLRARFQDGTEMTQRGQQVRRGAALTWTLGGAASAPARLSSQGGQSGQSGTFVVVNQTDQALHYLYASSCSQNQWGPDQLGSDTVATGSTYRFSVTPGCWDFRARFADGQETVQRGQRIASGGALTWTVTSN